jgi:hypothetical protein
MCVLKEKRICFELRVTNKSAFNCFYFNIIILVRMPGYALFLCNSQCNAMLEKSLCTRYIFQMRIMSPMRLKHPSVARHTIPHRRRRCRRSATCTPCCTGRGWSGSSAYVMLCHVMGTYCGDRGCSVIHPRCGAVCLGCLDRRSVNAQRCLCGTSFVAARRGAFVITTDSCVTVMVP